MKQHVLGALFLSMAFLGQVFAQINMENIKVKTLNPDDIKVVDMKGMKGKKFDMSQITNTIIKVYFREKYLKQKEILVLSSELEEELGEKELTYQQFNVKEDSYIWIMCNNGETRTAIREYLTAKETVLTVVQEGLRYYGKFATKTEKAQWKEKNKGKDPKKFDL